MIENGSNKQDNDELIHSIEHGLAILHAFSKEFPELTLSEIAERTNLSERVVKKCLETLQQLGYVGKKGKLFILKPEITVFSSKYLDSINIGEVVRPYIQHVRDVSDDSCSFAVLSKDEVLFLIHETTNRSTRHTAGVGTKFPVYPTALGRVLLAYQEEAFIENYLRTTQLKPYTHVTVTARDSLLALLARIREQGHACQQDEFNYGIVSLAVPIFNRDGRILAAINCSTTTTKLSMPELVETRLPLLAEAKGKIEAELEANPILSDSILIR